MTARTRRLGVAAVATVAAAWWLLLAVAFLLHRGDDVGRLPELAARFLAAIVAGPVWSASGLLTSIAGVVLASLIGATWYGVGDLLSRAIPSTSGTGPAGYLMPAAERLLLGAAAWSLVWFLLGTVALYRVTVAVVALLAGVGLAARSLRGHRPRPAALGRLAGRGAVALAVTGQVLALLAAVAPPTAKDTLLYHFALPKAYIAAGRALELPYNVASYYPLGIEMHVVWAMLLGEPLGLRVGEAAAGATLFLFAPLLAAVVYGWAREWTVDRPGWALVAPLMIAWTPTVYHVAASAYVDLALTAYTALAVRAFGRWWTTLDSRRLPWLAVAVGAALSIKLSAAFLILPLTLLALVRILRPAAVPGKAGLGGPATGGAALSALVLGVVIAAPWYIRNWIRTGSPLFPFYLGLWPGHSPGWDLERSRLYETFFSLYGDAHSGVDYLLSPVRLAVAAQLDQVSYYDGVLGIAFLFAVPLLAWALWTRRLDVEIRLALLLSACLYVFWLFSSQQLRYLLPAAPALAVASAAAGCRLGRGGRAMRWMLLAAAALGLPVVLAWFLALDPTRVVLGGEARSDYLRRHLDYYPYYELVNRELPATAVVWLIDMRRDTYYLERSYFSDFIFEDYTLIRHLRSADRAEDIQAWARHEHITHLLVRHDVLFDPRRSPVVDDRQSPDENRRRLQLMGAFFTQGTRLLKGDQKFWLIELPQPPARGR